MKMKNLLYDVFEYKITSLLVAVLGSKVFTTTIASIMGSRALQSFMDKTDWFYLVFGMIGFMIMLSYREVFKVQEERQDLRYWIAKAFLSITIPVMFTDFVVNNVGFFSAEYSWVLAVVIGMVPEVIIIFLIKRLKKETEHDEQGE